MIGKESVWSRGSSWSRPALVMVIYLAWARRRWPGAACAGSPTSGTFPGREPL